MRIAPLFPFLLIVCCAAAHVAFTSSTLANPPSAATWEITEPTPDRTLAAWVGQALK